MSSLVASETAISESEVKETMRELREAAKQVPDLRPPTLREQEKFFDIQQTILRNSTAVSERERRRIDSRLEAAKTQHTDAPTFYSWKNVRQAVLRKSRAKIAALLTSVTLAGSLAACGGPANETPLPPPPSPSTDITQPVTPSPDPTGTVNKGDVKESQFKEDLNEKLGVVAGATREDKYGAYTSLTLSEDSPLLKYDASKFDQGARDTFGDESLERLNAVANTYFVEESLDSEILNTYDPANWQEDTQFLSEYFYNADMSAIQKEWIPAFVDVDYEGRYDEGTPAQPRYDGGVRTAIKDIEMTDAVLTDDGGVDITWKAQYVRKESAFTEDSEIEHNTSRRLRFYEVDGQWYLGGAWIESTWTSNFVE